MLQIISSELTVVTAYEHGMRTEECSSMGKEMRGKDEEFLARSHPYAIAELSNIT